MNLNDVIQLLPISIRGRFSASDNAWFITQAGMCIKRMEKAPVGPGRIRRVMAQQMAGGFIPKPSCLATINSAWLDGEEVASVKMKDDRGFPMDKGTVDFMKIDGEVQSSSADYITASINEVPVAGDFMSYSTATVDYMDATTKTAHLSELSNEFSHDNNSLSGEQIWIRGEYFRILTSSFVTDPGGDYFSVELNYESSLGNITVPLKDQPMSPAKLDSIAGFEINYGLENAEVVSSKSVTLGWKDVPTFLIGRGAPGRVISGKPAAYFLKSNLVVEGYRSLAKPTSMTDELDVPDGSEDLIASYLRWKGESDMDPDSSVARQCAAEFERNLRLYIQDQSQTDGDSMPHSYNMDFTLTGGRF